MALIERETLGFLGGRKYVIIWVAFFVATMALWPLKIAAFLEWSTFVLAEFGFYFAVDTIQKKNEGVETTKIEMAKLEAMDVPEK